MSLQTIYFINNDFSERTQTVGNECLEQSCPGHSYLKYLIPFYALTLKHSHDNMSCIHLFN